MFFSGTRGSYNEVKIQFFGSNRTGSHPSATVESVEQWDDEESRTGKLVNGLKWVGNKDSNWCNVCGTAFTTLHRRHHCRSCGHLVCGSCSPSRLMVFDEKKPSRVCDNCLRTDSLGDQIDRASAIKARRERDAARLRAEDEAVKAEAAAVKARIKQQKAEEKARIKEESAREKERVKEEKAAEKARRQEEKDWENARKKDAQSWRKYKLQRDSDAAKAKAREADRMGRGYHYDCNCR